MSFPIRRCSSKGKAIATGSDSESSGSPLIRRPRTITLGEMDNPRPTNADLTSLDDNERDVVKFSLELEDREVTGHAPADDMEQENELEPVQPVTPSADVDSTNKDKTSAEKISFALADFLPMRWTGTDFEFDEEIDPEQERTLSVKNNQNWANHLPTKSSFRSVRRLIFQTNPPAGFSFLIPAEHQRPWTPPAGYATVYESWFNNCSLWWPLPEFLTTYCSRQKIALGQYTANGIRIMVTLTVLAAELGITMSVRLFEELTTLSITAKMGFFYGKMVPKYNVITGKPSKVNFWNHRYFYVMINEASFEDPSIILNGYFNANIDRLSKWSQDDTESFHEEVESIRTLSHQHWPDISEARIQAALNKINRAEIPTGIPSQSRRHRMRKLNLASLPSYADTIGTPVHARGSSSDNRPAKRRRDSNVNKRAPHISPSRSPPSKRQEEHLGGDNRDQNLFLEENPPLDPVSEAEITITEVPTEEHPAGTLIKEEPQGDQLQDPAPASHGDEAVEYPHEAPAPLFRQIKLKRRVMPELDQLLQDRQYREMTRAGAIFFGNANLMVRDYEAKLRAQDASLAAKTGSLKKKRKEIAELAYKCSSYQGQIDSLVAEKNEAAEKAEFEGSRSELLSTELEALKAQKELLDSRCLSLDLEKIQIQGLSMDEVLQKTRANEAHLLEELQRMEVVDASEINLLRIGLDKHGSNMTAFSPQDIEDLRT
ncbi:hypothetical protein N665_0828s0002 [Sinapis alba]|nr:hypothetical protein N665_0828s0002 [Sinapis alba]